MLFPKLRSNTPLFDKLDAIALRNHLAEKVVYPLASRALRVALGGWSTEDQHWSTGFNPATLPGGCASGRGRLCF